jgi:photosystem II stability/assembly factor-like uncharacterized protein
MRRSILLASLFLIAGNALAARRHIAGAPIGSFPGCAVVTGTPAVTFTVDGGRTLAPTAQQFATLGYTYGLAALDTPATLLAWHQSSLLLSTDDGCSWRSIFSYDSPDLYPPRIQAAKGGGAYIWSDNRDNVPLFRYDPNGPVVTLKAPGAIIGLGVDANDGNRVMAGDANGVVWISRDGGQQWAPSGRLNSAVLYRFAFDSADPAHIVAGTAVNGVSVSFDGGSNWLQSSGLGPKGSVNAFSVVISPADPNVVWAMALDTTQSDVAPAHGRHIYRSIDGGRTFAAVVDEGAGLQLINGPLMVADPYDADVLYFVFGTYFQGYGTDLFRYDASSGALTQQHNDYDNVNAIAFSTSRPYVMYLGLESERGLH